MKNKTIHRHNSTLVRHTHPLHWHGSMIVAIAAILLTSFKCSGEMIRALHALPVHADVMSSVYMRDAETGHSAIIVNGFGRHATYSGM